MPQHQAPERLNTPMDRKHVPFGQASAGAERMNHSRPHTPPYTPSRSKARPERADSPASLIYPTETVSPAKKSDRGSDEPDTIIIQELSESHPDYATTIELVYPHETEEIESDIHMSEESESDGEGSDTNIARQLSQLQCEDPAGEARMYKGQRRRRLSKRLASRRYKRPHSQINTSDLEVIDVDAMADHDSPATARRMRRRTRGPEDITFELCFEDGGSGASPEALQRGQRGRAAHHSGRADVKYHRSSSDDEMDTSE